MKQIIMALAIAAFAYSGAEAQVCRPAVKHVHSAVRHENVQGTMLAKTTVESSCRLVPYDVCTINSDRKSVSCFKTVDPEANQPLYPDEFTTYGASGAVPAPGQGNQTNIETITVKGLGKGDYCKRNEANDATVCYHSGGLLTRDENGFYHY